MKKLEANYLCSKCGHRELKWVGRCSRCSEWNTMDSLSEETDLCGTKLNLSEKFLRVSEVRSKKNLFQLTGHKKIDRILGGGLQTGSTILLGGAPGVGKSTLLLGLSSSILNKNDSIKILFVSAEECIERVAERCRRLRLGQENFYLLSENCFEDIETQIRLLRPDVLIIDSIQSIYIQGLTAKVGSVTQVRELANDFSQLAQELNLTCILIGHVNKEKAIAGPMTLEHIVDVVLSLRIGESKFSLLLSASKNRFAPILDEVCLKMSSSGLT